MPDVFPTPQGFDVVIIGAGAAGLMCAIEARKRGRRVLLLEHADRPGKKIIISGGGRCNFSNIYATPDDYLSQNPRFCVSALSCYTPYDFIALVEKHRIPYREKKLGQLFCDGTSQAILRMLLSECESAYVTLKLSCSVTVIRHDSPVLVDTTLGPVAAGSLVIATGGLSIPPMGATGFAYDIARQFGLDVTPTRAGLVPFTFAGPFLDFCRRLTGVAIPCVATYNGVSFTENLLFTHRGLSGPAILQISSHWRPGHSIVIDLLPDFDLLAHLKEQQAAQPKKELVTILSSLLPKRFAQAICETALPNKPMAHLSLKDMDTVVSTLKRWTLSPAGTEGYRTAEVTLGGVDTTGLSSKTMEALKVPGLFFIGEGVDVTGPLGGYNFQWAWASGYCAGQYV
jgi:predicted Rossmann fold flavoprotein